MNQEQVLELYERANPMKDFGELETALETASYLANLQDRSSEVTQLDDRAKTDSQRTSRTWLAIAALVAVVVGVAVVMLTTGEDEANTAANPATTTAVPDPEASQDPLLNEALAVATAVTQARADHDMETMVANSIDGRIEGLLAQSYQTMPDEFAWQDAVGWSIEIQSCEVANPDLANTTVVCHVVHNNAISEALGEGPFPGDYSMKVNYAGDEKLGVVMTETTVTEAFNNSFAATEFRTGTWQPFVKWLSDQYPEDVDLMLTEETGQPAEVLLGVGPRLPQTTPESIELWRQHVEEFVAEQSG